MAKSKKVPFKRPPSTNQSDHIYGVIANKVNDVNDNGESKRRKV